MIEHWIVETPDEALADAVMASCRGPDGRPLPRPIAAVLARRGLADLPAVERYLSPRMSDLSDPLELSAMPAAAERIWRAIERGERIVVHGDYDVDGVSSTALLVRVLRALGADAGWVIPDRVDDGYGLSPETVARCVDQTGAELIVTVDCGTSSVDAVREASRRGVDVIVTDHHEPGDRVAEAAAVVNPKLGAPREAAHLAGVGVAFMLCFALIKQGREAGRAAAESVDLRRYMDFAALGTVADVVSLVGDNRILARHGLAVMESTHWEGIRALMAEGRIAPPLKPYHIGFVLGPRLNAAGRVQSAELAARLLLTDDAGEACRLASDLERLNVERQSLEKQILQVARAQIEARGDPAESRALVVAGEGWAQGVVGIVASRLAAAYGRPAIVISLDGGHGRGSCRSVEGYDLLGGLTACADHLLEYGGHRMAAGLEVEEGRIDAFRAALERHVEETMPPELMRRTVRLDGWIDLSDLEEPFLEALSLLQPTGEGNPEPVWGVRGVRVVGAPRVLKGRHLKLRVAQGSAERDAIGFGLGEAPVPEGEIDLAFRAEWNEFRGRRSLQMNLVGLRPTPDPKR
jgi:single-stranded-DNA-specific exonuclease